MMKETRMKMLDDVVRLHGHESAEAQYFAMLCEDLAETVSAQIILEVHYDKMTNQPKSQKIRLDYNDILRRTKQRNS